jgi:transcriptional regulator with XRE-family HTH domain
LTPEALKAARKDLSCTAKELAQVLGLEQSVVLAWEKGELFPTKQYIDKIEALRKQGPSAIPKKAKVATEPMKVLADPRILELLRKVISHKKLRDDVLKMADGYDDPAA